MGRAFLRAFGWTAEHHFPDVDKAVVIAAPHTSGWDLPFMIACGWALDVKFNWVGKKELFAPPFGSFMRMVGGLPVNRGSKSDTVGRIAEAVRAEDKVLLCISPEGTRSTTKRWKSGFYWIAVEANVPIVLGFLDFGKKRGGLGAVFWPTGDIVRDMDQVRAFYSGMKGRNPGKQSEIALASEDEHQGRTTARSTATAA